MALSNADNPTAEPVKAAPVKVAPKVEAGLPKAWTSTDPTVQFWLSKRSHAADAVGAGKAGAAVELAAADAELNALGFSA